MICLDHVREEWVRPALQTINLWTPSAENFILGIGLVESGYTYLKQLGNGPAKGFWEMEGPTEADCWTNFLAFRPALGRAVNSLRVSPEDPKSLIRFPLYAAAMARVKVLRSPVGLPTTPEEAAAQHKRWYNTALGATDPAESVKLFKEAWK